MGLNLTPVPPQQAVQQPQQPVQQQPRPSLFGGIPMDTRLGIAAIGQGLSQMSVGQAANLGPAHQALMQRQQRAQMQQSLRDSGLMEKFTPEQRAILAQMEPSAAQSIIAQTLFRGPAAPPKPITVNGQLVDPSTGRVIGDYRNAPTPADQVMVATDPQEKARFGLPDDGKAYEITMNPDGTLKNVSGIGGGDTNVSTNVDLGDQLSPGREAVDKAFAETYLDWRTGGDADAANQAGQISSVLERLESGEALTGPSVGLVPDFARAIVNPEAKDAQERVEGVVQRSLKAILGSQFTEGEGTRLIQRAYNPALAPEQNAARLRALFIQLESAAASKAAMVEHFEKEGTLWGYDGPSVPAFSDFHAIFDKMDAETAEPATDEPATASGGLSADERKYLGLD